MIRILLVIVVLILVLVIARKLMSSAADAKDRLTGRKLVKCRHCGLYISEDSAVSDGDDNYCSEEHRSQDKR